MTIFARGFGGAVENTDDASYLTQRLRQNQPEPYEREVERATKRAGRVGFALGSVVSLALVAATGVVLYFFPDAWVNVLAVLE